MYSDYPYLKLPRYFFLLLMVCYLVPFQMVFSQSTAASFEPDDTFQLSFVPGVSTSDSRSTSRVSFNIIGGYNGGFHGFELGWLLNANRYNVSGVQLAGLANVNRQQATGVLAGGGLNYSESFAGGVNISGAMNLNRTEAKGVFLAGGANYTGQFTAGLMTAGAVNISNRETRGVLIAGGANIAGNQMDGLILAGALNVSDEAHGVAISPINIAKTHTGVQFGVFNITGRQNGTQIGIINIAGQESEGKSIGLLSFVKGGRLNANFWSSETGFINGGIRIGTQQIYNVLSIGYNPFQDGNLWKLGIGLGFHKSLDNNGNGIETDLMHFNINYDKFWSEDTSSLIRWRAHYTRSFSEQLGLFTGPALNVLIVNEDFSSSFVPYAIVDEHSGSNRIKGWIGWTLGLKLF